MISTNTLNQSTQKAIKYLSQNQKLNGSFPCFTSSNLYFSKSKLSDSIFLDTIILSTLSSKHLKPLTQKIRKPLNSFLLSQKSKNWTFNYWKKSSKSAQQNPYPDDLDVTSVALSAIYKHNSKLITGTNLAFIINILTKLESKEGGPYRTWLVTPKSKPIWKDVDLAVNANIAYFLSLQEVSLPNITTMIEKAIKTNHIHSPYYPSYSSISYFISNSYRGKQTAQLIEYIQKHQTNQHWSNPLDTALNIISLIQLGYPASKLTNSIEFLLSTQLATGNWPAHAFCLDPIVNKKQYYSGSPSLTTSLCLQALSLYPYPKNTSSKSIHFTSLHQHVIKQLHTQVDSSPPHLKKTNLESLAQITQFHKANQITLTPFLFNQSLKKPIKSKKFLTQLSLANTYGWIAYTIYDDFLDNEGQLHLLSSANYYLRHLTNTFTSILPSTSQFVPFFHQIMDQIDNANTWEIHHSRFEPQKLMKQTQLNRALITLPNFNQHHQLAHKSIGHSLGPIAILFKLGYLPHSKPVNQTLKFFTHYLIARQLNDDAHDWLVDLKKGQLNAVSTLLLKSLPPKQKTISLTKLNQLFWENTITQSAHLILKHTLKAEKILNQSHHLKDKTLLLSILNKESQSAQKALSQHKKTIQLLQSYST